MNLLFVDTETTGLPTDQSKSYKAIDNWPSIRQIAWLVYTKDGKYINERNYEIGDGDGVQTLGIDYQPKAEAPIYKVLPIFLKELSMCDVIIGHNIEFDVNVILSELYRLGLDTSYLESVQQFCTMKNGVEACGFDTKRGDRYPKLQELYTKLFHHPFDNAHDAYCDIQATAKCYWKLFEEEYCDIRDYPFLMGPVKKQHIAEEYAKEGEALLDDPKSIMPMVSGYIQGALEKHTKSASDRLWDSDVIKMLEEEEAKIVHKGVDKALELLRKAANLGHVESMVKLGHFYYNENEMRLSALWYLEAIDNGYVDLESYFEAAKACSYDREKENYCIEFYSEWAKLCESNFDSLSGYDMDLYIEAFRFGRYGQEKDIHKAIDLCQRAISLKQSSSGHLRYTLAGLLQQLGDDAGATEQYIIYAQELIAQGDRSHHLTEVEEEIIRRLFQGIGIAPNYSDAKQYITDILSREESNPKAQYYLGQYYEKGLDGYEIDEEKAFACYLKASERIPDAMKKIGIMYSSGQGCQRNEILARVYLERAKRDGLDVSSYLLPIIEDIESKRKKKNSLNVIIVVVFIVFCVILYHLLK